MSAQPSPQPIGQLSQEAVDEHRDIDCRHYDDCLDRAVRERWSSWSCAACPVAGTCRVKPEVPRGDSVLGDDLLGLGAIAGEPATSRGPVLMLHLGAQRRITVSHREALQALARGPCPTTDPLPAFTASKVEITLRALERKGMVELDEGAEVWRQTGRKICRACKQAVTLDRFEAVDGRGDGYAHTCTDCTNGGSHDDGIG